MNFSLVGYTNIPTDGSGRILITDIAASNEPNQEALICLTDVPTPNGSNFYIHPTVQTTSESGRIQSFDSRGWQRNRDLPNGIMRLRRDIRTTSWTEGVFTCQYLDTYDLPIFVGVYYPSESHSDM